MLTDIKPTNKLFVYGTLMRTYGNNKILQEHNAKFLYESSVKGFVMWDLGGFPAIVKVELKDAQESCYVTGELWEVSTSCLDATDILEGVDAGFYWREKVSLLNGVEAFTYTREFTDKMTVYQRIFDGRWRNKTDVFNQLANTRQQSIYLWPHTVHRPHGVYNKETNTWDYGRPRPAISHIPVVYQPYVPPKPKHDLVMATFGPVGKA